ncbi:MAG: prolipoprotein diacylglyceryl transferase [Armatimonadota bacterium]
MHPILFYIFGIPIRAYGLMLVVGFLLGVYRASRVAKANNIPSERIWDLGLVVLVSGIFGARMVYILLNPANESFAEFFKLWNGGLSFHGGMSFAILAGWIFLKRVKIPFWTVADIAAPSAAIGYAVARIGCFLNGCCYGAPTSLFWGTRFVNQGTPTPPSHPTQLYASLANVVIFFMLTRLEKNNRAPGLVFVSYLGMYSVYRFMIEFLRKGYTAKPWILGLTQAQGASLVIIIVCVASLAMLVRKK